MYVPKLKLDEWAPAETINYELRFKAPNFAKAFELANSYKPHLSELTGLDVY